MLQRIQSIWLLLASLLSFVSLQTSFYSGNKATTNLTTNLPEQPYTQLTGMSDIITLIFTIGIALLALITIFLYKTRKLQMRLALAGLLASVLLIVLYYLHSKKFIPGQGSLDLTALIVMGIPFFFFLAIRGIYHDENLVKSADKLR
jgi:DMSO/TMAO reductase YedYZ heme-binding membrane subunit